MFRNLTVALFLAALALALILGAQADAVSWGPALVALGLAAVSACLGRSRWQLDGGGKVLVGAIAAAAGWTLGRCLTSPVAELGRNDALLVGLLLGSIVSAAAIHRSPRATSLFYKGLLVLTLANCAMAIAQLWNPELTWPYESRPTGEISGFFGHKNYFSNLTLTVGLLLLARACFADQDGKWRLGYFLAFLLGAVLIPISESRGGALALGAGLMAFLVGAGFVCRRRKGRAWKVWKMAFPIACLLLVTGGVAAAIYLKEKRSGSQSVADNMDRLLWINVALEASRQHWWTGGGSGSFRWEKARHWEAESYGRGAVKDRFVHNEIMQVVTEYGLVGAILVLAVFMIAFFLGITELVLPPPSRSTVCDEQAIVLGAFSAGSATLFQSNASFVFHLAPGIMLLGVTLGMLLSLRTQRLAQNEVARVQHLLLRIGILSLSACLIWMGIRASTALTLIWKPLYFGVSASPQAAITRINHAESWWPGFRFHEEMGMGAQKVAQGLPAGSEDRKQWNQLAISSYTKAAELHPFSASIAINLANCLTDDGQFDDAESWFLKGIELQGGMEAAYQARLNYVGFLYVVWYERWTKQRRAGEALHEFRRALEILATGRKEARGFLPQEKWQPLKKSLEDLVEFLEAAKVQAVPVEPAPPIEP